MATYYLETSALVKRYALERGSAWVERLCDQAAGQVIFITQVTQTETVAALCRKARVGAIGPAERDNAIALFRRHVRRRYALERVTNAAYIRAGDLCCIYNLRAYDSIQLACAWHCATESLHRAIRQSFLAPRAIS